jgi:2-polyprenyl-6-methoxyphenol hydroxylase-like FAD-dependent oxidoreductase
MSEQFDVVIVGGGIGGGALGAVLARAGKRVLVLEKTTEYRDRVRGEWIAPWGVAELQELGLYDAFIAAGAHHVSKHVSYGDGIDPAVAEASALPLVDLLPGIPGPLCFGHPASCNLLHDTAVASGATVLRDVTDVTNVTFGASPSVTYVVGGNEYTATCKIVVGADGRGSLVRRAAGIELHRDPTHHLFSGMLIEGADGWPEDVQMLGAEGDVHYLAFPQGNGRVRLYLGYSSDQAQRLAGAGGQQAFLDAFRLKSVPLAGHLANGRPAGPCNSYPNEDSWTDEPYSEGMVLIGDAAGHNDPIIGQGLSITYRDVRTVRGVLLAGDDWSPGAFVAYGEERRERMRRLRFVATLQSLVENEFGAEAEERRRRVYERRAQDPVLMLPALATMLGPEKMPPAAFEDALMQRTLA